VTKKLKKCLYNCIKDGHNETKAPRTSTLGGNRKKKYQNAGREETGKNKEKRAEPNAIPIPVGGDRKSSISATKAAGEAASPRGGVARITCHAPKRWEVPGTTLNQITTAVGTKDPCQKITLSWFTQTGVYLERGKSTRKSNRQEG